MILKLRTYESGDGSIKPKVIDFEETNHTSLGDIKHIDSEHYNYVIVNEQIPQDDGVEYVEYFDVDKFNNESGGTTSGDWYLTYKELVKRYKQQKISKYIEKL